MNKEMMQDSGVEWIGEIPQGWKQYRIKDIAELSPSYSEAKPDLEMLCTVIPMECVSEKGNIDTSNVEQYENISKGLTFFEKGDVIFAKITPCMENGKGAYIENLPTKYAFGSTEFHVLRTGKKLNAKFLYYYTFNGGFRDYAAVNMTGAAGQKRVSTNFLKYTPIYLPDISEQQAIAQYLEQRCGKLDAIIAIKQQQIKTLDALRQSIIYQAVTKGLDDSVPLVDSGVEWLGKIPQDWRVSKLKYITNQIVDGTHFTPNYVESGVPFLRVTDIQTPSINFERIKFITEEEHTELTKRAKPQKGDVLLSKNGTIGITKVVDWDWEFSIFVSLCLIKFLPNISPYYFSYFFESDVVNQQLFESSKKTSVTNLHLVKIRELLLCVPPFHEQQRIIDHLDQETQSLNDLKENLSQQISTLEAYKKALIYECVTGKKRINADVLKAG
jgi:type I restriction enzyme, S subunit